MRNSRRVGAAGLLVTAGLLLSPSAVPVYDGVGVPDEPYRYVAAPAGRPRTAAATPAVATSPVRAGASSNGLTLSSAEVGPQVSVFVPAGALGVAGAGSSTVTVRVEPQAPADPPPTARTDGNVYRFTLIDPAGPVVLTPKAALATLYLRATTAQQPGPVMEHRSDAHRPWTALPTSRGGQDIYVAGFVGAGDYVLAFPIAARAASHRSVLPYVLVGLLLVLVALVLVIRLRSASTRQA